MEESLPPEQNNIEEKKPTQYGPILGLLIIVILLVIGGIFFLKQSIEERDQWKNLGNVSTSTATSTVSEQGI